MTTTADATHQTLAPVITAASAHPDVVAWVDAVRQAGDASGAATAAARVSESMVPLLVAALREGLDRSLLVVVPDDAAAERLAETISWFTGPELAASYLSRGVRYGAGLAPSPARVGSRERARSIVGRGGVVVMSVAAAIERVPRADVRPGMITVAKGQVVERDDFLRELVEIGYERTDQAEARGQFAVRGDIVDVFATTAPNPVRIEFFDDEVEQLRVFSPYTQRSLGAVDSLEMLPASEVGGLGSTSSWWSDHEQGDPVVEAAGGLEPAFAACSECRVLTWDSVQVQRELDEELTELASSHALLEAYDDEDALTQLLEPAVHMDPLTVGQLHNFDGQIPTFGSLGLREAEGELQGLCNRGLRVVVTFPHAGHAARTAEKVHKVKAHMLKPGTRLPSDEGGAWFAISRLGHGFISRQLGLAVVPSGRLFRQKIERDAKGDISKAMAAFSQLRAGDHVVHEDHGIGRFAGFETRTVAGVTRDYLYIEFVGEDRLYVPHEQMGKVTRYIGSDSSAPALSKLGGKRWANIKNRTRHAVRELAGELLALYAKRSHAVGHAYPEDDELVERFELSFPYQETDDQLKAIAAVKEDMERPQPMDRLICGDVGFGKTEVAMRAAVKAVAGHRQVMVLVPTTVLANQHLQSFRERIGELPIEIDMVSRFRSKKQIDATLTQFRDGKLDILIGTHRLLSRDVLPRNLGLVIVDEEQRFGVAQKEMLRHMRLEVDVMALSATPIPRTLHMSLTGIRDITMIETAPTGRRPIHTHVGEYDEAIVRMAIERELERDGQVFYLHNRVETIDETAVKVANITPKARITIGHGQMAEKQLEAAMMNFLRGDYDVLVSTTIIESGIDIPTANTLIVERADMLGLSQLYQIRGRVGRSARSAHAYLFYPSARELSEEARARLTTLSDFTDLGSGARIAMRDLELRGAGNLLGDEQSGHVAAVGFELYVEMLAEAVNELSGNDAPIDRAANIDVRIDAYVPADYVESEATKIDLHRRISLARSTEQLEDLTKELEDRFGEVPGPVLNLVTLSRLRMLLNSISADRLSITGDRVLIAPVDMDSDDATKLRRVEPLAVYSSSRREVQVRLADKGKGLARAEILLGHLRDVLTGA